MENLVQFDQFNELLEQGRTQDFLPGGKRAEGPYIFKHEASFILPYMFKVK